MEPLQEGTARLASYSDLCYTLSVKFEIIGEIEAIETIAVGNKIRVLSYLQRAYGRGRWRKLKGIAYVRLPNGHLRSVELHWYEAHGIGRKNIKIKHFLD